MEIQELQSQHSDMVLSMSNDAQRTLATEKWQLNSEMFGQKEIIEENAAKMAGISSQNEEIRKLR